MNKMVSTMKLAGFNRSSSAHLIRLAGFNQQLALLFLIMSIIVSTIANSVGKQQTVTNARVLYMAHC